MSLMPTSVPFRSGSSTRRGALLVIVSGMSALLVALATTLLFRAQSGATQVQTLQRKAQARMMLPAATSFILERGRIGYSLETYSSDPLTSGSGTRWPGMWGTYTRPHYKPGTQFTSPLVPGTLPDPNPFTNQPGGIVHFEAHGWVDVRDAHSYLETISTIPPLSQTGLGWLDPNVTQVPTIPASGTRDWAAGSVTPDSLLNYSITGITPPTTVVPLTGSDALGNPYDFNGPKLYSVPANWNLADDFRDQTKRVAWLQTNLASWKISLPASYQLFTWEYWDWFFFQCRFPIAGPTSPYWGFYPHAYRAWMCVETQPTHAISNNPVLNPMWDGQPSTPAFPKRATEIFVSHGSGTPNRDPEPLATPTDITPRDYTKGLAWFRVYRKGPATFTVTCGAGATRGFKDWQEVLDTGSTLPQGDVEELLDPDNFAMLRATEVIYWYEVGWDSAVAPALADKPVEATTDIVAGTIDYANYQALWSGSWYNALGDQRDLPASGPFGLGNIKNATPGHIRHPLPSASNVCGTITYIKRLREEPADW